jgi:hypothetical protein
MVYVCEKKTNVIPFRKAYQMEDSLIIKGKRESMKKYW